MQKKEPIKLLFVCLGNICRSPTAEAVFKKKVRDAGLEDGFRIDSAGILSEHEGEPADARMRRHARKRGLELESISRPVRAVDFETFDLIIAMDFQNVHDLKQRAPDESAADKISLFLEGVPGISTLEVPDPYYGGAEGFEEVLDLVDKASDTLLKRLGPGNDRPDP